MSFIFTVQTGGRDRYVRADDIHHARRIAGRAFAFSEYDADGKCIDPEGPDANATEVRGIGKPFLFVPSWLGTVGYDDACAALPEGVREANRAARTTARAKMVSPVTVEVAESTVARLLALVG